MGQTKPFETSTETKSKNPTEANPKTTPDGPNSLTATVPLDKSQNPASAEAVCPNGAVNEVTESKNGDSDKASVASSMKTTDEAVSDIQKKIRRAERFGISVQLSENDKRSSRAERFGTAPPSSGSDEEKKRKARAERFGLPATPTAADEEAKKKARLSRFAEVPKTDSMEDEKRKARAARFLTLTSSNSPQGDDK